MEPSSTFRQEIQNQRKNFRQAQESITYAHMLISKEKNIGPGQCARLAQSLRRVEEPLRHFHEMLDTPDLLPPSVQAHRHPLLFILDSACILAQEVIFNLSSLYQNSHGNPDYEIYLYRKDILHQLENLDQKRDAIEHGIECLLFQCPH